MRFWYEVHATEIGGKHTEIIHCKNKREAEKVTKEYKKKPEYEMVYYEKYDENGIID